MSISLSPSPFSFFRSLPPLLSSVALYLPSSLYSFSSLLFAFLGPHPLKPARGTGERCELPQWFGAEPGRQTVSVYSGMQIGMMSGGSSVEEQR